MNKTILLCIVMLNSMLQTSAQVKMPEPAPLQTIKQSFGMGAIELIYSRPNLTKGRKIYGDLVPYNKLWRTGANAATKIIFTDAVELSGKKVDSGTYVLYTIPGLDSWEIILNKGLNNWGIEGYKENEDVARFRIEPVKMKANIETLTMQFLNIKPESCELHIMWSKTAIVIPITTNIKDRLRVQIEKGMQTENKPYWQAAQFYNEYDHNQVKALDNCNKAITANNKAFWIYLYKAKIQKEMGDKAGAKVSAQKSLELAKDAKNEDYIKMNEELLRKLK
ncbi:DUF2911 domain-containing protein [Ferruginibacter sp. SUN106]|uniref:DUF2911 domain-containing protein n=1 Tax=Ferruginibacter sp. SUN106 TaxID=2978348 RepID=UPI003D36A791